MTYFYSILLSGALTIPALAQDAKTNATAAVEAPGQTLLASAAVLTAPMILTNGAITLSGDQAEVTNSGNAVFTFTIATAGNYVFETLVNGPADNSNSFFANVDALPEDPDMIWDIEVTMGFEKRLLSWRGNGDSSADQFSPKRFTLTAGVHKLNIIGREPDAQLKSLTIRPAPPEAPAKP
jgi:hypothetical protein